MENCSKHDTSLPQSQLPSSLVSTCLGFSTCELLEWTQYHIMLTGPWLTGLDFIPLTVLCLQPLPLDTASEGKAENLSDVGTLGSLSHPFQVLGR